MQTAGVDFIKSYAPVANWSTIQSILILSLIFGLESRQMDFINAFAQAPLKEEVFIELPKSYVKVKGENWLVHKSKLMDGMQPNGDDYVLFLNKSLYGLVQAPKAFYKHLCNGMEKQGFKVSNHNPCLFLLHNMIVVSYVDDVIAVAKDFNTIQTLVDHLKMTVSV